MAAVGSVTVDLLNGVVNAPRAVAEVLSESGADGHGVRLRALAAPDSTVSVVHFCADASAYQTLIGDLVALIDGTAVTVTTSAGTSYTDCDVLQVIEVAAPRTVWDGSAAKIQAQLAVVVRQRA